ARSHLDQDRPTLRASAERFLREVSEDGLTVDRCPGTQWRKMAHRRRPPYEDQDARISILSNGVAPKGRIRFCRLLQTRRHKPLADGAGHTFCAAGAATDNSSVSSAPASVTKMRSQM